MKYSLVLPTARSFENIEPLFIVSSPDAEIIIIDSQYDKTKKEKISKLKHNYNQVIYAQRFDLEQQGDKFSIYRYRNDKNRSRNTGFMYCEGEWVYKLDDSTELCPDFFKILDEDIDFLTKELGNTNFVIRPVKLEEWNNHKKWDDHPLLKRLGVSNEARFIQLDRNGLGNGMFITLDQCIATRNSFDIINGMDERYDIGHGDDDVDLFQRYISLGYTIILDRNLKTYQKGHKREIDPIPFTKWLFNVEQLEIENGRYRAYNPYDIKEMRPKSLENKKQYEIKKEDSRSPSIVFSGLAILPKAIHTNNGGPVEVFHIQSGQRLDSVKLFPDVHKIDGEYYDKPKWLNDEYPFDKFFTKNELDENNKKILALKDKHKGQDLFILGNSPDITREFIDKIRGKTTFAANGFLVMKDKWNYEPTYMVVSNQGTFDNHLRNMLPEFKEYEDGSVYDLFKSAKTTQFILSDLILKPVLLNLQHLRTQERIDFLKKHVHITVLNKSEFEDKYEISHETPEPNDICFDLSLGTYLVGTVITDLMFPLAVWMGFKNIYLKGCSGGAGHFYDISPRHFWDEDKQKHMYQDVYAIFKKLFNEKGINIYNLDRPTVEDDLLENKSKTVFNPTKLDGHYWDGPVKHHVLGKHPYVIGYKALEEIL